MILANSCQFVFFFSSNANNQDFNFLTNKSEVPFPTLLILKNIYMYTLKDK